MIAIERRAWRRAPRFSSLSGCLSFFRLGCLTRRGPAGFFMACAASVRLQANGRPFGQRGGMAAKRR
ncbi:hypothetical protein FNF07_15020 [Trinickia caryophylli]|nr:hypothetical protein C0Z17_25785 [Trinickia caryophylli]TRX19404.1 hypothetical protein FNF07_15020 [Trinickia caryophylli]